MGAGAVTLGFTRGRDFAAFGAGAAAGAGASWTVSTAGVTAGAVLATIALMGARAGVVVGEASSLPPRPAAPSASKAAAAFGIQRRARGGAMR